jgi:hypothetical protein
LTKQIQVLRIHLTVEQNAAFTIYPSFLTEQIQGPLLDSRDPLTFVGSAVPCVVHKAAAIARLNARRTRKTPAFSLRSPS